MPRLQHLVRIFVEIDFDGLSSPFAPVAELVVPFVHIRYVPLLTPRRSPFTSFLPRSSSISTTRPRTPFSSITGGDFSLIFRPFSLNSPSVCGDSASPAFRHIAQHPSPALHIPSASSTLLRNMHIPQPHHKMKTPPRCGGGVSTTPSLSLTLPALPSSKMPSAVAISPRRQPHQQTTNRLY